MVNGATGQGIVNADGLIFRNEHNRIRLHIFKNVIGLVITSGAGLLAIPRFYLNVLFPVVEGEGWVLGG